MNKLETGDHYLHVKPASLPACVGVVVTAVAVGVAVAVLTSLLLEDAAVSSMSSTVEFCFDGGGALSALPLANWLWSFWAV